MASRGVCGSRSNDLPLHRTTLDTLKRVRRGKSLPLEHDHGSALSSAAPAQALRSREPFAIRPQRGPLDTDDLVA